MAITKHVQHPKSSATTANTQSVTVPRLPSSGDLLYGEIAVNYRAGYETLSIKNSSNNIVGFTPNGHQIDATMTEGLSNGQIGMDANNVETFYIYHFEASRWRPLCNNYLADETELAGMPVVQDPQFVYLEDPGLMYYSVYDQSTTSQTWTAMATLNPINKRLADTQEPKVIIDYFSTDALYNTSLPNVLVYDVSANKLKQYGDMYNDGGVMRARLLYTYDPSKNVIYYKSEGDKAYRWNGTTMTEILSNPTIATDATMSASSASNTVTVSSTMFSADTTNKIVMNKMTPASSANSHSHSSYSLICGIKNTVNWSSGVTTFGFYNTISDGSNYSFVEGINNSVSGIAAHAEGSGTSAFADYSHTQGVGTEADGTASFAAGSGTTTNNPAEFACGRFNDSKNDKYTSIFTVGCGTSNADRKNGLEVDDDGVIWILNSRGGRVSLQDTLGI